MLPPLENITILDLSRLQSGPSCSQMLGYLGAYVIKIEDTNGGDVTRLNKINESSDHNSHFTIFNNTKESITLNLKTTQGKAILEKLILKSDVILENFSHGIMEKLGFSWSHIKNINPEIIYASIKGYSNSKSYKNYKSFESTAQAISGLMSVNRDSNQIPKFAPIGISDSGAGLHMVIGILAALMQRDRDGGGQKIEVSLYDSMVNLMRIQMMKYINNEIPKGISSDSTNDDTVILQCRPFGANDYLVIHLVGEMLENVLILIGREDLLENVNPNNTHNETIISAIREWTKTKTKTEAFHELAHAGIWCAPVMHPEEISNDPYLIEKNMITEIPNKFGKNYKTIGLPINFELTTPNIKKAPEYGEHTDKILKTLLNLSEEEITTLKDSGVVI
ncbi:MAG: CoA transferase [Dehalococcoidia bacterium]